MIVPAGLPDLHQFARQEARHYYLNGTPETELDGVKFQLGGGLYDAPSGVTCYVTYPKADYASGGTLRPRMSQSALYRERTIGTVKLESPFLPLSPILICPPPPSNVVSANRCRRRAARQCPADGL